MKKDRTKELLNELRDRDFTIEEMCKLFWHINYYLDCRQAWIESVGTEDESYYQAVKDRAKKWLQDQLDAFGLSDYTIDEFVTFD